MQQPVTVQRPDIFRCDFAVKSDAALAPVISANGPISDAHDVHFGELAHRAAEGDSGALCTLHAAFAPRLDHWIRRAQRSMRRYGSDLAIESEDVAQEAFIVFTDTIYSWPGAESFSAHVIAYFPWRLSDAIRRMSNRQPRQSLVVTPEAWLTDDSFAAEEAITLLESIAAALPGRGGPIVLMRFRDRMMWNDIALALGVDRRTILRDWTALSSALRCALNA